MKKNLIEGYADIIEIKAEYQAKIDSCDKLFWDRKSIAGSI